MTTVDVVCQSLASIAPLRLAESWDNVGLLIGDRAAQVDRVMTCLTITPDVIDEAIDEAVGMIVAHHPLPFKPISKITSDTISGSMMVRLVAAGIAVYSAHTAFDSAKNGINAMWAESLALSKVRPLQPIDGEPDVLLGQNASLGRGRYGYLAEKQSVKTFARIAVGVCGAPHGRIVTPDGTMTSSVHKVGIACGSGGSMIAAAARQGCDTFVTGEATFHGCLEARSLGVNLILVGHYHSERFAMERLASTLAVDLTDVTVFASRRESDPLKPIELPTAKD